ncbi:xylose isomerase [Lichenibacterium minor]|uniref:Xylose isomerase n=1 Tax=Lichenibacterium minor TaxID=2316528 RepID=A0A4Q2TYS4_9HYPH|nr:TIM barrel protein [Lichenibacterium minor]RYC29262.1 xylose isomerase [Lichenibacterium minor]
MNAFSLNHRVAPAAGLSSFFDLAVSLGIADVEIRNELPDVAIADGTPADTVRREAEARGLTVLSINALYPFNIWNDERAGQASRLIEYAAACGARGIVMCPLNDASYDVPDEDRLAAVREALAAIAPMLRKAGVVGLVEPLGFPECSLRIKREALDCIDAVDGADVFRLVHDTFHHHVAGETELFPDRTGLVHVSGVTDPGVPTSDMKDAHRVLVDVADRLDNVGQVRRLVAGGYLGPLSFEPFADSVSNAADIRSLLADSMAVLRQAEADPAR